MQQHRVRCFCRRAQLFLIFFFFFVSLTPAHAGYVRPIIFPVDGPHHFSDDFGDPRSGGRVHLGNDIISAKLTPVVAAVNGVVSFIVIPQATWGYAVYLRDDAGWEYDYLHLNNDTPGTDDGAGGPEHAYAPGIVRGAHVTAGQLIAWVGDSGNAENAGSHLHFEIHDPTDTAINPYESLLAALPPAATSQSNAVTTKLVIPKNGILVKYPGSPEVYWLANQVKQLIVDEASFAALNFSWDAIRTIPVSEGYRSGVPIEITAGVVAVYDDGTEVVAAASTRSTFRFTATLSIGSHGTEVTELQRVLSRLGYYTYPSITGYFGNYTRSGVIAFQKAHGIAQVGYVGPATRAALNAL